MTQIIRKILLAIVVVGGTALSFSGQRVAVKTNVLDDAALNINLGVEVGLAPKWSAELSGSFNNWTVNGHKWKHWWVMPEGRYWFCDRLSGHFLGVHAVGGEFNTGNIGGLGKFLGTDFSQLKDKRYQGWNAGVGVGYGYAWILGKHWNLEAEIGIGWIYAHYDVYPCAHCGTRIDKGNHNYVGPTKAAINLVYLF